MNRHLNLVDFETDDGVVAASGESAEHPQDGSLRVQSLNLVATTRPGDGASAPAGDPPSSAGATLFDVEAHDVELGDILIDAPHTRVAFILFAGTWLYFDSNIDSNRIRIASHALGALVQVVRAQDVSGEAGSDSTVPEPQQFPLAASPDTCAPHGLERPRARLIRGGAL